MNKIAGLFPGQGSQSVGMGQSFQESSELARELFATADEVLGFSLSTLCFEGPIEKLTLTEHAQPAILTVSYIAYRLSEVRLSAAAGHSLGEFSALVAAGSLRFEDAVQLVHKRGRYMQEAVPAGAGAMAAVMGPEEEAIQACIDQVEGIVEIANLNCPGQTVVAGEQKSVAVLSDKLQATGAKVIPLNVSAPFHCSMMKPAAERLGADLAAIEFKDPAFPVYANVTAEAVTSGETARALLVQQVCSSVRWTESMQRLIAEQQPDLLLEFGNGDVLTKLLKRIDKGAARANIANSSDLEKFKNG